MISIRKKFLFIHYPKTGGNSVQNILKTYSEDKIVLTAKHQDGKERFEIRNDVYDIKKHSTLARYKNEIEKDVFDGLFTFTTIRNPWDRMISFYFSPNRNVKDWNRDDFQKLVQRVKPLKEFISLNDSQNSCSFGDEIDCIMRFEHLNKDFKRVCDMLDLPKVDLPHRNKSFRKHYSYYYDEALIDLVQKKFSEEVEFGKYRFETP